MSAATPPADLDLEACLQSVHRGEQPPETFVRALSGATVWLLAAATSGPAGQSGTRLQLLPDPGHDDQRLIATYLSERRARAAAAAPFTPLAMPVRRIAAGASDRLGLMIDPGSPHALRLAPAALRLLRD
jgi:hypothetical protein